VIKALDFFITALSRLTCTFRISWYCQKLKHKNTTATLGVKNNSDSQGGVIMVTLYMVVQMIANNPHFNAKRINQLFQKMLRGSLKECSNKPNDDSVNIVFAIVLMTVVKIIEAHYHIL
jgi:hypothetical protein